jgi:Lrp/AsnC family transcriptional regulator
MSTTPSPDIDPTDMKILAALQTDATLSVGALAERINLSRSACWRRVKDLEARGIIRTRVTLLDAEKLGLGITVFAMVRTNRHDEEWLQKFTQTLNDMPAVLEFYRTSGDVDYLLKIVAKDIKDYDTVYRKLIRSVELLDVSSSFVMDTLKYTTALPIGKS